MGKHKKVNTKYKVENILEVRVKIIEALAKSIGSGAFFSDSIFKEDADEYNKILKNSSISSENIKEFAKEKYSQRNYMLYDLLKVLEMFKSLRSIGCYFKYRTTENKLNPIRQEIFSKVYERYCSTRRLGEKQIRIVIDGVHEKYNAKRDKCIISNIKNRGLEENILYVGIGHKLEELESSGLEHYEINIKYIKEGRDRRGYILMEGKVPYYFEKNMLEAFKTEDTELQVRPNISYV